MIAFLLTLTALVGTLLFPFWFSVGLAFFASVFASVAPFAVGVLMDTLYFSHGTFAFPLYSVLGLAASLVAFAVRRFVKTSIMR